jgi:hypothetical protein
MMFTARVYLNCDRYSFDGYQPEHQLATDADLVFCLKGHDSTQAANELWVVGNRMGCDLDGKTWPTDVRSLSKGDVIKLTVPGMPMDSPEYRGVLLTIDRVGFTAIAGLIDTAIVPLAGQDRVTSRPTPEVETR